jgi:hypothetical protein
MLFGWALFQFRDYHGDENEAKNSAPEIADAAATQSAA